MRQERQDPADARGDSAEEVERLEDLEASDEEAANVKGGGPREAATQTGGRPGRPALT